MRPIPVHFAIDLEPDKRLPVTSSNAIVSAGDAFREMASRRDELANITGAPAHFGWYVRMDRHMEAVYGDAGAIAARYRNQIEAAAAAGDEIGLHIHSIEQTKDGGWRANYADSALIDATIDEAAANFLNMFGRPARAARMGDMWTSTGCMEALASNGVRYDVTMEAGLRPQSISALYPNTNSRGHRPSMLSTPLAPYQPGIAGGLKDFWILPLSSFRRRDFLNPGMWLVSAYSAVTSGFQRNRARIVFRPQAEHTAENLRRALDETFAECETPSLCVAIRNFGVADRIHRFLDVLVEIAQRRPMRFVGPADYVRMATDGAPERQA